MATAKPKQTAEQLVKETEVARANAVNRQAPLQGLAQNPSALPVAWKPAATRRLADVTDTDLETIEKDYLVSKGGDLYIIGSKAIDDGKNGPCYLFRIRAMGIPGVHNSFFGAGLVDQRDDIHRALQESPQYPIGPLRLEQRVTKTGQKAWIFVEADAVSQASYVDGDVIDSFGDDSDIPF